MLKESKGCTLKTYAEEIHNFFKKHYIAARLKHQNQKKSKSLECEQNPKLDYNSA